MYNKIVKKLRFCFNLNHTIDENCYFCERNALFIAFLLNFIIFGVELFYGIIESSAALLSDSGHNVGDAIILGSSVFFLAASIISKAKLAIVKCVFWVFFGGLALYHAFLNIQTGSIPSHFLVGSIGVAALIVNISTVIFMSRFKENDINITEVSPFKVQGLGLIKSSTIRTLIHKNNKFIGHVFSGKYLDCGTMNGYINSTLEISKLKI